MKKLLLSVGVACSLFSAQAAVYVFDTTFQDPEVPANNSPGVGYGLFVYDNAAHTLDIDVVFGRLLGNTTVAHIHAPTTLPFQGTASVATTAPSFVGFPTGVTFGAFSTLLDLTQSSSYHPSFLAANGGSTAAAEASLAAAMIAGKSYFNIHTSAFSGGEIRGFLTLVPEPSSFALLTLGGALAAWRARRKA